MGWEGGGERLEKRQAAGGSHPHPLALMAGLIETQYLELRESFSSGRSKEASWRKSQLQGLRTLLKDLEKDIFKALELDLGKHYVEAFRDEVSSFLFPLSSLFLTTHTHTWFNSKSSKECV